MTPEELVELALKKEEEKKPSFGEEFLTGLKQAPSLYARTLNWPFAWWAKEITQSFAPPKKIYETKL